jgi:hypothetical protein
MGYAVSTGTLSSFYTSLSSKTPGQVQTILLQKKPYNPGPLSRFYHLSMGVLSRSPELVLGDKLVKSTP